jgi:ubiquinone/menaquinone biosynthesis C-methylase UbiE
MATTLRFQTPEVDRRHVAGDASQSIELARLFDDMTLEVVGLAGITGGMSVIDIGCGTGELTRLLSRQVGPRGRVLAVDRSAERLATARLRSISEGLTNVQFAQASIDTLSVMPRVDAVVGRQVMLGMRNPIATLRALKENVKPGGVMLLHELDFSAGGTSSPPCALWDQSLSWIRRGLDNSMHHGMGPTLTRAFVGAGLGAPQLHYAAKVESGPDSPAYAMMASALRAVLPTANRVGVGSVYEVDAAKLASELRREICDRKAIVVTPHLVGAWARVVESGA